MKKLLNLLLLSAIAYSIMAQPTTKMEKTFINTSIGQIAVFHKQTTSNNTPIIFLHGVFFDHHLWDNQINAISDRPVYAMDMPMHGESKSNIKGNWTLDDCADMLLEIMDSLGLKKVIAVGHSWGSMTILRAANKNPDKFESVGLCNMPFKEASAKEKRIIKLQQSALIFKSFYMKQAAKALMAKESRDKNPGLIQQLTAPMSKLSKKEIRHTNKAVRIDAKDGTHLINSLQIPAIALVGKEDYVGIPPIKETKIVQGGHVSPLEVPTDVMKMILAISQKNLH
ncbi:MAG: alpha/beta hydrolase [Cyclobacteriaceae bacterium]|nr:alpha/beta hydrolase [Cyclobacteriaceae bacterium]